MTGEGRWVASSDAALEQIARLQRQQAAIVSLARSAHGPLAELQTALREITRVAAVTLEVERASVWLLSTDRQDLRCLDLYELSRGGHSDGIVLTARNYPRYFAALETGRAIDAHDAREDSRTNEFRDGYLVPLGITSMMDAAVRQQGSVVGVVCHEHVGPSRSWTPDEVTFAGAVADQVSLALAAADRRRLEEERARMREVLLHAQKLESLGVLAGGIAHDFNNLLGVILGNAVLARDAVGGAQGAEVAGALEDLVSAAERASHLTRQLLAYSGRGTVVVEPIDLNAQVREISDIVRSSVDRKAELVLELEPGLPGVEADVAQIQQVVMNLLLNGVEAIGDSTGRVRVATSVEHAPEPEVGAMPGSPASEARRGGVVVGEPLERAAHVVLTVEDSGSGMTEETRARIFDPFFTTKGAGRGLGLAAVLGIVRAHRGALELRTAPGQGTTFRLYLPARDGPVVEAPAIAVEAAPRGEGTILVIDDEPNLRALNRRALEGFGYRVLVAATGPEGIDVYRSRPREIGVVLLDMTMPEMSGVETFEALRREFPDATVILTSGYHEDPRTQGLVDRGLAGFLPKPHTPEKLAAKIAQVLRQKKG